MRASYVREATLLALILFAVVFLPNASNAVVAKNTGPIAVYEPAMSGASNSSTPHMPLPVPTIGYAPNPAPVSGVLRVLIIAAEFTDLPHTISIDTLKSEWVNQVAKYYQEDSYGTISLSISVFGWIKLPYNEAHYGADCIATGGIDDAGCTGQDASWNIAQDAAIAARNNVTFANYDYYVFVHSGNGQESSGVTNDVWSVTYLGGVWVNACLDVQSNCNQKTLTKFNIDPELEAGGAVPIGVYCHEFGHNLGLPDLYNTNTGKTILGPWSLMDKGLWNGNPPGSSPSHMDAWSKIQLGFMSGSMIATADPGVTTTYSIDSTEIASSNVHAVIVPLGSDLTNPSQYYVIEVRSGIGFDAALPSAGVLVLYVDTTQLVGKVRIMNANPSVSDLSEATWTVGQTFTDSKNGWFMTVAGHNGNSYQVTVNRGGAPPPPPIPQNQTYIALAISSVSAQPQVITLPNTTVTITVLISNSGTEAANNVPIQVNLDAQLYTNLQVSVNAGSSSPATFTWVSTVGTHTFKVIIDPDNTLNNTNRANNSATFTLNVGPTLTINVPLNITTAGNVWVMINGAKYNITSSQFQTSVPNGTITVEMQPGINVSQGVREGFAGWSDGNTSNPRQVTVTSGTVLQALYTTQYLLSVNSNGGTTTPSAWYSPNSTVTVTASNPSNVTTNASRYLFSSWSGDLASTSTSLTVTMKGPVTLQANWIKQYYVTIISPTGSPSGEGWYNAGTVVTVGVQSTVQYSNGTRMIFNGWNSTTLGSDSTAQITVNSPTRLLAAWRTQYLITVNSEYGPPIGGGWYDAGASVQASVPAQINYSNATRRIFTGWTGDFTGTSNSVTVKVNSPKTLTAQWSTQYLVTFAVSGLPNSIMVTLNVNNVTYSLPAGSSYQIWVQKGTVFSPMLNQTISTGITTYKFGGWLNATGGTVQNPLTVNAPSQYVASYTSQLSLPPVPGFPIEGILVGLFFGLVLLVLRRDRKRIVRRAGTNILIGKTNFKSNFERITQNSV
jgi:M6 family metalloprotease-like protein